MLKGAGKSDKPASGKRRTKGRPKQERDSAEKEPAKKEARHNGRRDTLWTIGHSTRSIEEFIALLRAHDIQQLVDVRTIPRSRHNPQFNRDELLVSVKRAGIHYLDMPALGGLRHTRRDSINTAWKNKSFRGYADYMQTPEFENAVEELIRLARQQRTAIMCAEAVPWRCHRSLIADALVVRGWNVNQIISSTSARPHILTPWSHVVGEHITYPAAEAAQSKTAGKS